MSSSGCRCFVIPVAMFAVTTPNAAIPVTISTAAMTRPSVVTGAMSPYPTVVTVVMAHHAASPKTACGGPGGDAQSAQRTVGRVTPEPRLERPAVRAEALERCVAGAFGATIGHEIVPRWRQGEHAVRCGDEDITHRVERIDALREPLDSRSSGVGSLWVPTDAVGHREHPRTVNGRLRRDEAISVHTTGAGVGHRPNRHLDIGSECHSHHPTYPKNRAYRTPPPRHAAASS